jgi:Ca-activated chloride channel family protein
MMSPWLACAVRRNSITIALSCLVVTAAAPLLQAQFSSGVNLVEVYASVTDASGNPVTELARDDFQVRENGEPQAISAFSAGDFPLSVVIAVDRSFSMAGTRLAAARSAARAFLGDLRTEDEAAILAIGSEVETMAPLSVDRATQRAALDRLDAFGTTGLYDAIIKAIDVAHIAKGRRALVLLSDGSDRYSRARPEAALQRARESDVMVYPIALGSTRPVLFAELAAQTGGRSFELRDPRQLADTLHQIARELRHQYLLGYVPTRPPVAGSSEWRSIRVTVIRPGVRVTARDGYIVR